MEGTAAPQTLALPQSAGLRRTVLGIPVDAVTRGQAVEVCLAAVRARRTLEIGVVNVAKLVTLQEDRPLREAIVRCGLIIADGLPVVWAGRLLGQPLPERVTGIDLFLDLLAAADREQLSVYLLGATPEVLEGVAAQIRARFPKARIAGMRDGYFRADEEAAVAEAIRRAAPDMLFVGISTPKKELFLGRYGASMGVPVCHGVGGSFDVLAGKVQRAPELWQRLGVEWLYRLLQEPRRMWRRYLTTNSAFVYLLARALLGAEKPLR